jgi:phosphatidylglycerophosphate synthase
MLNQAKESYHHIKHATAELAHRTRDEYLHMSPEDRKNCREAFYYTIGGVVLTAVNNYIVEPKVREHPSVAMRLLPTTLRAAAYYCDYADGKKARGDAATELGGIVDPLADKAVNFMNETTSDLPGWHVAARVGRDAAVTAVRSYVTSKSNGKVNIKATKAGKYNTLLRDVANIYNGSPLADEFPTVNKAVQSVSTVNSVASGGQNIFAITKKYRDWQAEQEVL